MSLAACLAVPAPLTARRAGRPALRLEEDRSRPPAHGAVVKVIQETGQAGHGVPTSMGRNGKTGGARGRQEGYNSARVGSGRGGVQGIVRREMQGFPGRRQGRRGRAGEEDGKEKGKTVGDEVGVSAAPRGGGRRPATRISGTDRLSERTTERKRGKSKLQKRRAEGERARGLATRREQGEGGTHREQEHRNDERRPSVTSRRTPGRRRPFPRARLHRRQPSPRQASRAR